MDVLIITLNPKMFHTLGGARDKHRPAMQPGNRTLVSCIAGLCLSLAPPRVWDIWGLRVIIRTSILNLNIVKKS